MSTCLKLEYIMVQPKEITVLVHLSNQQSIDL